MKTWIMANQVLAFFIAILFLIAIIYLIKYLVKTFSSDRVIDTEREVIVQDTVNTFTPMRSFNTAPQMSTGMPSMGPAGVGVRVSSGGRTH